MRGARHLPPGSPRPRAPSPWIRAAALAAAVALGWALRAACHRPGEVTFPASASGPASAPRDTALGVPPDDF